MRSREDLFLLIRSMTPSERRYFRLHATQNARGSANQTLALFDALAGMDAYDARALHDLPGVPHLAVTKHYLEELLLRLLSEYHGAQPGAPALRRTLSQLETLFARGLFDNAMRRAEKGYQSALGQDQLALALELLRWRMKLLKRVARKGSFQDLLALQVEEEDLLLELVDESQLRRIHDQMFALLSAGSEPTDPNASAMFDALMQRPIVHKDPSGLRFNSRLIFHYIHVYAAQYRGDDAAVVQHYATMVTLWEQRRERREAEPGRYAITLMAALESNYRNLDRDAFYGLLEKIRAVPIPEPSLRARAFHFSCHLELTHAINTGTSPATQDLEGHIVRGLDEHGGLIDAAARLSFYCNLAILHFLHGRYKESLHWTGQVYQLGEQDGRRDIHAFVMTLRLILQYELGEMEHLGHLLASTRRSLQRRVTGHPIQAAVISHLQRIANLQGHATAEAWAAFAADLRQLAQQFHEALSGLRALLVWVEHKSSGVPMARIVQRGWDGRT